MEGNAGGKLEGVERTMLLPLWGRWSESRKEGGLIHDLKCLSLVERLGIDLEEAGRGQNPASRLAWVTRAWNLDRELRAALALPGPLTVLCIGCGLDTVFYRVDDGTLRWYDLDLPAVMGLRERLLSRPEDLAEGRLFRISGSALEAESFGGLELRGRLFVMAVGLLYYFDLGQVKKVFENIALMGQKATVLIDYCSAMGVTVSNMTVLSGSPGVRMIWSAEDDADLAALHPGLKVLESYPLFHYILPLLKPEEAAMARASDERKIMSFARMELTP